MIFVCRVKFNNTIAGRESIQQAKKLEIIRIIYYS